MGERAAQGLGQPAQRLLELEALVLRGAVDLGHAVRVDLATVDQPALDLHELLEVALESLGQVREDPQAAAQRVGVVLVALVVHPVLDPGQPPQQRVLLGDREVGVDLRPRLLGDLAGEAGPGEAVGLQLDLLARARLVGRAVLGEDDLVGHRREVDLVGFLVEVVLLGEVVGVEVVADVDRLAVVVALLRGLGRFLGQGEVVEPPRVLEVVVPVAVPVAGVLVTDPDQREERVEELVEGRLVAHVLDQRHPQSRAQGLAVGEDPGSRAHRIASTTSEVETRT